MLTWSLSLTHEAHSLVFESEWWRLSELTRHNGDISNYLHQHQPGLGTRDMENICPVPGGSRGPKEV